MIMANFKPVKIVICLYEWHKEQKKSPMRDHPAWGVTQINADISFKTLLKTYY